MVEGVSLTILIAKKFLSVNLTSRAYPSNLSIFSAKFSFDRQVPAYSESGFADGFSRPGFNFPGMECAFEFSDCRRDFFDGRGCGLPKEKDAPNGAKV